MTLACSAALESQFTTGTFGLPHVFTMQDRNSSKIIL